MTLDPINQNCFIPLMGSGSAAALPVIAMQEPLWASPAVIFVPGEAYSFYINKGGVSSFELYDGSGNVYSTGASFSAVAGPNGATSTIMNVSFPTVPSGVYQGVVAGVFSAGFFEVMEMVDALEVSAIFEFSHNLSLGDFYYPYAPEGYAQMIRLRCSAREYQPEINVESYQSTATGRVRNLQGTYQKSVIIETYDYDLYAHEAMAILTLHDNIKINGKEYIRKGNSAYQTKSVSDFKTYNGEFGLYENKSTILFRA